MKMDEQDETITQNLFDGRTIKEPLIASNTKKEKKEREKRKGKGKKIYKLKQ